MVTYFCVWIREKHRIEQRECNPTQQARRYLARQEILSAWTKRNEKVTRVE